MKIITTEIIKSRLSTLYNTTYDLSLVNYTGMNNKITLVCVKHGPWSRMAQKELIGKGCPKCNIENIGKNRLYNKLKTTEEFLIEAVCVHGDIYNYSLVDYKNSNTKIQIICPSHGIFRQLPWGHLKYGCRSCGVHKSKVEKRWISSLNNSRIIQQFKIAELGFTVDGYDPLTKTVYEFYGDYWHGNPKKFDPNKINTRTPKQKTFGLLYQDTLIREEQIKNAGYNLVSIWESDFR